MLPWVAVELRTVVASPELELVTGVLEMLALLLVCCCEFAVAKYP